MSDLMIELSEFLRTFSIQDKPQLMLFLGAGASVGSGIPTASQMVWMFKREIFCSETRTSKEALRDLSLERNRHRLQEYFRNNEAIPARDSDEEYSFYFGKCYSDNRARRSFVRSLVQQGKPTIGHECLAVLLAQGRFNWVWTTNFDDLIERAERPDAPRRLSIVSPESNTRMSVVLDEKLFPVLVKLHGAYRYDSLQNTSTELRSLDDKLRDNHIDMCRDSGIIVIGYIGRDESVMSALEKAADTTGIRNGLYWCVRWTPLVRQDRGYIKRGSCCPQGTWYQGFYQKFMGSFHRA